MEMKKKLKH